MDGRQFRMVAAGVTQSRPQHAGAARLMPYLIRQLFQFFRLKQTIMDVVLFD